VEGIIDMADAVRDQIDETIHGRRKKMMRKKGGEDRFDEEPAADVDNTPLLMETRSKLGA
jgi:hypothetical protein